MTITIVRRGRGGRGREEGDSDDQSEHLSEVSMSPSLMLQRGVTYPESDEEIQTRLTRESIYSLIDNDDDDSRGGRGGGGRSDDHHPALQGSLRGVFRGRPGGEGGRMVKGPKQISFDSDVERPPKKDLSSYSFQTGSDWRSDILSSGGVSPEELTETAEEEATAAAARVATDGFPDFDAATADGRSIPATTRGAQRPLLHYGTKTGQVETLKIHFPTSEGMSEVSERVNE